MFLIPIELSSTGTLSVIAGPSHDWASANGEDGVRGEGYGRGCVCDMLHLGDAWTVASEMRMDAVSRDALHTTLYSTDLAGTRDGGPATRRGHDMMQVVVFLGNADAHRRKDRGFHGFPIREHGLAGVGGAEGQRGRGAMVKCWPERPSGSWQILAG